MCSAVRVFDSVPIVFTAFTGALLQSFLTRRASNLFHSNLLAQQLFVGGFHLLIAGAFLAEVGEMVVATLVARDPRVDLHGFTFNNLGATWLWTSTFVDGSLSLALYALLRRKYAGGSLASGGLRSVVRVSFQTAALTSVFSLTGAACGVAFPSSDVRRQNVILAFCLPLGSLYALSLLVTLASRTEQVALVTGTTLAGYQRHALLDGLAGAQAGGEVGVRGGRGRGRAGVGAKRGEEETEEEWEEEEEDFDDDEEEEEGEEADGGDERNRGRKEWQDPDRDADEEMGPESRPEGEGDVGLEMIERPAPLARARPTVAQ